MDSRANERQPHHFQAPEETRVDRCATTWFQDLGIGLVKAILKQAGLEA
jgi:hypothetical protein